MTSHTEERGLLRSWIDPSGEQVYAVHPFWVALKEHHEALAGRRVDLAEFKRLVREYGRRDRSIPDSVQVRARELEAEQQANGWRPSDRKNPTGPEGRSTT
jgi:hypothetical protein